MFSPFYTTKLQWRRVAVYQPVIVAGTALANEDGSDRQRILRSCQVGMHVFLSRESAHQHDPNAVAVFVGEVSEGNQIGHLPADVGEWVAPLLDSERMALDAIIWSLEQVAGDNDRELLVCRLMLTQHELVPVKQFAWTAWLRGNQRSAAQVPSRDSLPNRFVEPQS
jgi:hypothetical protein